MVALMAVEVSPAHVLTLSLVSLLVSIIDLILAVKSAASTSAPLGLLRGNVWMLSTGSLTSKALSLFKMRTASFTSSSKTKAPWF